MTRPPGFEEIQQKELARLFGRLVAIRLLAIPLVVLLALAIAVLEPARWRVAVLGVLLATVGTYFVSEAVRYRSSGFRPRSVLWNLLAVIVAQTALCIATGALESPFTYTFVPLAVMIGIFGPPRRFWALILAQLAVVWGMTGLELARLVPDLNPTMFGGGPRAGHGDAHLVATAILLSAVVALASRAGRAVRNVFDAMLAQALLAQEDTLRAHTDRAEELTALSGEIAHELKNPLASVKGLAALLAEAVPQGKPAERLGVLRREVERMQGILDEFLNFSRPLVPLALEAVDLAALADEVVALHEGVAQQHGVALELRAAAAETWCDRRKVKQVLINLVQNAVEASAPGGKVEIEVRGGPGGSAVAVLDRGAGVDPRIAPRAFEPGVTSKSSGSGLGLTIARALARQHGGDVVLQRRPDGGCVATLSLPAHERDSVRPPTGSERTGSARRMAP